MSNQYNPYQSPQFDQLELLAAPSRDRPWRRLVAMYGLWAVLSAFPAVTGWLMAEAVTAEISGGTFVTVHTVERVCDFVGAGLALVAVCVAAYVAITYFISRRWGMLLLTMPCVLAAMFYSLCLVLWSLDQLGYLPQ